MVCEDDKVKLRCPQNYSLHVVSAEFGRQVASVCSHTTQAAGRVSTMCGMESVVRRVREICGSNNMCQFKVTSDTLGAVCPAVFKYLKVTYLCQRK